MATSEHPRGGVRRVCSAGRSSGGKGEALYPQARGGWGHVNLIKNAEQTLHTFFDQLPSPHSPQAPGSLISLFGEKSEEEGMLECWFGVDEKVEEIYHLMFSLQFTSQPDAAAQAQRDEKVNTPWIPLLLRLLLVRQDWLLEPLSRTGLPCHGPARCSDSWHGYGRLGLWGTPTS